MAKDKAKNVKNTSKYINFLLNDSSSALIWMQYCTNLIVF